MWTLNWILYIQCWTHCINELGSEYCRYQQTNKQMDEKMRSSQINICVLWNNKLRCECRCDGYLTETRYTGQKLNYKICLYLLIVPKMRTKKISLIESYKYNSSRSEHIFYKNHTTKISSQEFAFFFSRTHTQALNIATSLTIKTLNWIVPMLFHPNENRIYKTIKNKPQKLRKKNSILYYLHVVLYQSCCEYFGFL